MDIQNAMFSLLRSVICGVTAEEAIKAMNEQELSQLFTLAQKHSLAHLVGQGLINLGISAEGTWNQMLQQTVFQTVFLYEQMQYEYQRICTLLEQIQVSYIPLKGSVLRQYYPEPWMRTSCDIDILVKEEDLDKATVALVRQLQYDKKGKGGHDISLFSPGGIHLELHFDTVEEGRANESSAVLSGIWEDAQPKAPDSCQYIMSDAMFYFYHVAHMAKHFEVGGCGVRPFLDMWILNHQVPHDRSNREKLLKQGKLKAFADGTEKMSEVWFSGTEPDAVSQRISDFILHAGVYGSKENLVAVRRAKQQGRLRFLWERLFPPYSVMKTRYLAVRKHKWLTPWYWVVRLFAMVFNGRVKASLGEAQANMNITDAQVQTTAQLLNDLGL